MAAATSTPKMTIPEVHSIVPVLAPAVAPAPPREQPSNFSQAGPLDRAGPMRAGQRSYLAPAAFLLAVAGLFVLPLPMGAGAILLAGIALPRIDANPMAKGGGLAWTGLVVGVIDVGFWVVWMLAHMDV